MPQGAGEQAAHPAPSSGGVPRVAICVATYGRPVMLRALLESLAGLRFSGPAPELRVVVVDNDADQGAREVVDAARAALPMPVRYEVEPERNIARARNRSVAAALQDGAEWVAFVDDDETVDPGWIQALLDAQARYGADVVAGAVRARPGPDAAPWVERSRLFGTAAQPTGTLLTVAQTSNALVSARLLRGPDPFDPAFGVSGGSDSQFFIRHQRRGARLVWCQEAVVEEWIPGSRVRAGWILRRAFRVGNCALWAERSMDPGVGQPARRALKAGARLALGVAQLAPAAAQGRAGLVRALWNVSYGTGAVAALLGYRYKEYRTTHGE